ncbi:MAG: hypothetical protein FWD03_08330 [Defluviitaleaceae bacterium]|nr:hypothetical protein [Defluviitaleaceae bacterium]
MQAKLAHHNAVILKGRKDGITISLDSAMPFSELITHFKKRVEDTKQFFEGASSNVSFTGRSLSDEEEQALLDIITEETALDVPYVAQEGIKEEASPPFNNDTSPAHLPHNVRTTSYHQGGLRSGQTIRYSGSVVVIGDVNPGSEIMAEGHVIVLGALKGLVHAGCNGDDSCFVSGLVFAPTQLRIANIITYIPDEKKLKEPACAYIQDGQVFVSPLMN